MIELVLSYTRNSRSFYMNYSDIADHLVIKKGKTKAKVVEKIIRGLGAKGYIIKDTKHNYNGKQGGSSTTMNIDETFLEEQLHKVFNLERFASVETEVSNVEPVIIDSTPDEPVAVVEEEPLEAFISPVSNLWDFDEEEDKPTYIDADMTHVIAYDGVAVKLRDEVKFVAPVQSVATEPTPKPQLSKEKINSHLRSLLTKQEYNSQHSAISTMLNNFATTKTDEEYNGFYYYILEKLDL